MIEIRLQQILTQRVTIKKMQTKMSLTRIQKQTHGLKLNPVDNVWVRRDGLYDFYFVIHGLTDDYKGGYYYGLLKLHENYPFTAPQFFIYTENGRFQVGVSVCTSFTKYHQESWTSAWNIRTLLTAIVSFMTCEQSSYGCRRDSSEARKLFAKRSLQSNLKDEKFRRLFKEQLQALGLQKKLQQIQISDKEQPADLSPNQYKNELQNNAYHQFIHKQGNKNNNKKNNNNNRRGYKKWILIGGVAICSIIVIGFIVYS